MLVSENGFKFVLITLYSIGTGSLCQMKKKNLKVTMLIVSSASQPHTLAEALMEFSAHSSASGEILLAVQREQ